MITRKIKPGFFSNDELAECKPLCRVLFSGLWCYSDKEGKFEWRPKKIKALILPYDTCSIEGLLDELAGGGFIMPYEANGHKYGYIPSFLEHQNPHPNEKASKIPDPDPETVQGFLEQSGRTEKAPRPKQKLQEKAFEIFWEAYPKKRSKGRAKKAFAKVNPDNELLAKMLATLEIAKESPEWQKEGGQYIPYPEKWLNAEGWEDEFLADQISTKHHGVLKWLQEKLSSGQEE